jgi:hypothetical protein
VQYVAGAASGKCLAPMPLLVQLREDQKREVRMLARIIGLEAVASQIEGSGKSAEGSPHLVMPCINCW